MPNFTPDQWVTLIQVLGVGGVLALATAAGLWLKVWPWFEREVSPMLLARWKRADTQLDVVTAKREQDQVLFIDTLKHLEDERSLQMRNITTELKEAIEGRNLEMIKSLRQIRTTLVAVQRRKR